MFVPPQHGRQTYPETCREDARAPKLHPPGKCWRSAVQGQSPRLWSGEQRSGLLGV